MPLGAMQGHLLGPELVRRGRLPELVRMRRDVRAERVQSESAVPGPRVRDRDWLLVDARVVRRLLITRL